MNKQTMMVYWRRKVNKIQDSLYLCIPKEYADAVNLRKGDLLRLSVALDGSLRVVPEEARQ
jgi:antitoxin component of MazEF toxin-antitoxin module